MTARRWCVARVGSLLAAALLPGCRPAPAPTAIACGPGGACTQTVSAALRPAAQALGLADLTTPAVPLRREVRVWTVDLPGAALPAAAGSLRRYVEDSAGVVTGTEVTWWAAGDSAARAVYAASCRRTAVARAVEVCLADSVGPPYAANRLRTLEQRGVWTLGGDGTPPDTTPCHHVCSGPGWIVVETRAGRAYRTYGAAYSSDPELAYHRLLWAF